MNFTAVDNLWLWGGVFVWLSVVSTLLVIAITKYRRLMGDSTEGNLDDLILENKDAINSDRQLLEKLGKRLVKQSKQLGICVQNVGLVRYNPFSQTGGNQSFSLALLDEKGQGIVVTSFHSRDATRVYAKVVKDGQAEDGSFSKEEKLAVKRALQ